jgi:hypothetical protein
MIELTPQQITILQRIISREFQVVAFPLYANAVGIRRGNYAALLDPIAAGGFRVFGEPCVLLDGNGPRHGQRAILVCMEETTACGDSGKPRGTESVYFRTETSAGTAHLKSNHSQSICQVDAGLWVDKAQPVALVEAKFVPAPCRRPLLSLIP